MRSCPYTDIDLTISTMYPRVVAGHFALSFSLKFLSSFAHISGSIALSRGLLSGKDLFLLQKLSTHDAYFGQI